MANDGSKINHCEIKAVPRSEFEALKRFGDYEELLDGTLSREEGGTEFRIYCDDVEDCPIGVMTEGLMNELAARVNEHEANEKALSAQGQQGIEPTVGQGLIDELSAAFAEHEKKG